MAAIHQAILAKVMRKLKKNKEVTLPIKGHGLYINTMTGTIHFEVEMDHDVMKMKATFLD